MRRGSQTSRCIPGETIHVVSLNVDIRLDLLLQSFLEEIRSLRELRIRESERSEATENLCNNYILSSNENNYLLDITNERIFTIRRQHVSQSQNIFEAPKVGIYGRMRMPHGGVE